MTIPLYLFAKAPIPGTVKTRMQPQLCVDQSARLAEKMMRQTLDKVVTHWPGKVIMAVLPDQSHPLFQKFASMYPISLQTQITGELGERLFHALQHGVSIWGKALVMGCDVPYFSSEILRWAWQEMQQNKEVIGPALDGGFYLLGVNQVFNSMFHQVTWGSGSVFTSIKSNYATSNRFLVEGVILRDIDQWQDLQWLARQDSQYQTFIESHV